MKIVKRVTMEEIEEMAPEADEAIKLMNTSEDEKIKTWVHQVIEVNREKNWVYTASSPDNNSPKNYEFPLDKFEEAFKLKLNDGTHYFTHLQLIPDD